MESFLEVMNVILNGFNLPFTVYGLRFRGMTFGCGLSSAQSPPRLSGGCCHER